VRLVQVGQGLAHAALHADGTVELLYLHQSRGTVPQFFATL
jgi:hypothetical protein